MSRPTKTQIVAHMRKIAEECRDSYTGEIDYIELAQWTADDLGCEELIEYNDSPMWFWAKNVAQEAEKRRNGHGF